VLYATLDAQTQQQKEQFQLQFDECTLAASLNVKRTQLRYEDRQMTSIGRMKGSAVLQVCAHK
jgi:hypothetical protein